MRQIYIPYLGSEPALITVKGHNFIVLARNPDKLFNELGSIGADHVRAMSCHDEEDEDESLEDLAREINGAIVIAPEEVPLSALLTSLAEELPWIH